MKNISLKLYISVISYKNYYIKKNTIFCPMWKIRSSCSSNVLPIPHLHLSYHPTVPDPHKEPCNWTIATCPGQKRERSGRACWHRPESTEDEKGLPVVRVPDRLVHVRGRVEEGAGRIGEVGSLVWAWGSGSSPTPA